TRKNSALDFCLCGVRCRLNQCNQGGTRLPGWSSIKQHQQHQGWRSASRRDSLLGTILRAGRHPHVATRYLLKRSHCPRRFGKDVQGDTVPKTYPDNASTIEIISAVQITKV